MKSTYNKKTSALITICIGFVGFLSLNGCVEDKSIAEKTGMTLWSENCQRCHNSSSSNTFSPEQWKTIGMHMQSRALLTAKERDKIIEFLQN